VAVVRGSGDLEAAIMDVVWATGGKPLVRDVRRRLNRTRALAFTTVQTVMEILYRKGWLAREKDGRAYRCWAMVTREEYAAGLIRQVLAESPNPGGVLVCLLEQIDPAEASRLRAALRHDPRRGP
jgi:predicted transcriptional regulator